MFGQPLGNRATMEHDVYPLKLEKSVLGVCLSDKMERDH